MEKKNSKKPRKRQTKVHYGINESGNEKFTMKIH